jgi:hypothetical protein
MPKQLYPPGDCLRPSVGSVGSAGAEDNNDAVAERRSHLRRMVPQTGPATWAFSSGCTVTLTVTITTL